MKNNGIGYINKMENQFTSYLIKSLRRYKASYIKKLQNHNASEVYLDENLECFVDSYDIKNSVIELLPMELKFESLLLKKSISRLGHKECFILMNIVLNDKSFETLAKELCMPYKTVSTIYYRALRKLKQYLKEAR